VALVVLVLAVLEVVELLTGQMPRQPIAAVVEAAQELLVAEAARQAETGQEVL
jgi:hypothetical protein